MSTRRSFLQQSLLGGLAICGFHHPGLSKTKPRATGFYRLEKINDRWWLIKPSGDLNFSLGLNHIDPASLRYPENIHIWEGKYENSMEKWLKKSVKPHLEKWGFNCVGWNREVVTREFTNHRHSRAFTYEEYQWLDMPYCHQLPFGEFHQWEAETRHPDFFSKGFIEWCDFVAREHCVPLANDPKLIGYFYIDCPAWLHTRPINEWKGPLFDPEKLESEAGKKELFDMATQYYQVTHDAIRRYDKNHLILGDRYEANEPLTMEIVNAARPYIDVLSFQDFRDPVGHLKEWYERTGIPVLWADGSKSVKIEGANDLRNDGDWYQEVLDGLIQNPGCVGAHLCGAFIRNRVRRKGLMSEDEVIDVEMTNKIRTANKSVTSWVMNQQ